MIEIKRNFRTILEQRLQETLHFIQVVLGPRQVGKTTGLEQIVKSWQEPSLMISADELITPQQTGSATELGKSEKPLKSYNSRTEHHG